MESHILPFSANSLSGAGFSTWLSSNQSEESIGDWFRYGHMTNAAVKHITQVQRYSWSFWPHSETWLRLKTIKVKDLRHEDREILHKTIWVTTSAYPELEGKWVKKKKKSLFWSNQVELGWEEGNSGSSANRDIKKEMKKESPDLCISN